ncbi:MAG: M1 family metallopeptidase [Bacteroidota bacterium]|nr:M1 family metallopeptidase [Bacteroidota bacterium]
MIKYILSISFLILFIKGECFSQNKSNYTIKDSLRGAMRLERMFDVRYYNLNIQIDPVKKYIKGSNTIDFIALENLSQIQLDLFENMKINSITYKGNELSYKRIHDAIFINIKLSKDEKSQILIQYEGSPIAAKNPPWDGGFVWSKDSKKNPWVGVTCEGIGASLWWPNKDYLGDEPDSMEMHFTVPSNLTAISNGRLVKTKKISPKLTSFHWAVSYPINNYNVSFYLGDYTSFSDVYTCKDSSLLNLDYYVLKENVEKAKKHFEQSKQTLEALEFYFGKYPFQKDGYALIESPYVGMEHQSAIAYGNQYQRGYLGARIPDEFNFDYIILHETAHEYWGNSVSCLDFSDFWIHESFATYSEALYVEYFFGKEASQRYLDAQKSSIQNKHAIIGPKDVNYIHTDVDVYYKGSWILHTLRKSIENDSIWFTLIEGFYKKYAYSNATSKNFFDYFNNTIGKNYTGIFRQYFLWPTLPKLQYKVVESGEITTVSYRWECIEQTFDLPVYLGLDRRRIKLYPTAEWKHIEFHKKFRLVAPVADNMLIEIEKLIP